MRRAGGFIDWIVCRPRRIAVLAGIVSLFTVAAIGLATWAIIKSVITETKVISITQRVVRLEAPGPQLRQRHLEEAIRDLTPQERRQLLDALLSAATPGQLHKYGLAPFRGPGGRPTVAPGAPTPGAGVQAPGSSSLSAGPSRPSSRAPGGSSTPPSRRPAPAPGTPPPSPPPSPVPSLPPLPSLPSLPRPCVGQVCLPTLPTMPLRRPTLPGTLRRT